MSEKVIEIEASASQEDVVESPLVRRTEESPQRVLFTTTPVGERRLRAEDDLLKEQIVNNLESYSLADITRPFVVNQQASGALLVLSECNLGIPSAQNTKECQEWLDHLHAREERLMQLQRIDARKAVRKSQEELSACVSVAAWSMLQATASLQGLEVPTDVAALNKFMLKMILKRITASRAMDVKTVPILDRIRATIVWNEHMSPDNAMAQVVGSIDQWLVTNNAVREVRDIEYLNLLFNLMPNVYARYCASGIQICYLILIRNIMLDIV